ncbi:hypothetical protein L6E12_30530 [Actinokineospora sp. PR83]|uniref:hypothetical protein n=1 Tax=Actinokineospora sp. PR83 TaxID=2884908 RepID=UPI001F168661|nr:hypothetical protein [Actinokineospora sp. PR83]MCG8920116.1 hypothetical protein [Actinokineospora sp. PR83]
MPEQDRSPERDDTTRHLCAAAHLDHRFADAAITEFLLEPTRSIAPSPGVDDGAVLAEAVAARVRRKLVDLALVLLAVALLAAAPWGVLIAWVVLSLLVSASGLRSAVQARVGKGSTGTVPLVLGGVVVLVLLFLLNPTLGRDLEDLFDSLSEPTYDYSDTGRLVEDDGTAATVWTVLLVLACLGVLVTDRVTVWRLVVGRFRRNAGRLPALATTLAERPIFQLAPLTALRTLRERYAAEPARIAADDPAPEAGPPVPVVVHRGYDPFVGAGVLHHPWSVVVPLVADPNADEVRPLATGMLYDGIVTEIEDLRAATTLTPGGRLARLTADRLVVVSADELIDHLGDDESRVFLEVPGTAPYDLLSERRALALRDRPVEWARFYRCFRVETWDRDLVMSVYLHVALDDTTLYVEWTPCVLRPISDTYQRIDAESPSGVRPVLRAALDLIRLPVSLPGRVGRLLRLLRPIKDGRGVINPDRYGSLHSLRELAADDREHNYFQLADRDRYLKILESRVTLAVSRMLRDAGYQVASFEEQVSTVINNSVHIGGSVTGGNVVAGSRNTITQPTQRRGPGK